MTTMDDLIQSLNGGAHVSQDLRALQDYLSQNINPPTLSFPATTTSTYRPLPPSRSTSTTRDTHPYSQPHEYIPATYLTPLPTPGISTEQPSQSSSRPRALRRSSSYDFSMSASGGGQSRGTSPYAEFSAFEGDAFAPLVQETCHSHNNDPWAKWKQQSPESSSVWSAFGRQQQSQIQGQKQMPVYGMQGFQQNQFGGGMNRYQSPRGRMDVPPTPPDEDDEMEQEDTEMQDDDEDEVEREMDLGMGGEEDDQTILRPGSAPGRLGINWTEQGFGGSEWERGRRNM